MKVLTKKGPKLVLSFFSFALAFPLLKIYKYLGRVGFNFNNSWLYARKNGQIVGSKKKKTKQTPRPHHANGWTEDDVDPLVCGD